MIRKYFFIFLVSVPGIANSQEEFVTGTFRGTQFINSQTVEVNPAKSWEFNIRHRFGIVGVDSTAYQEFLGLDLPANIRLGIAFPLTERLSVGIGRTKMRKFVDGEIKYVLLRQTVSNKMPVSVSLYSNAGIRTQKFARLSENSYYGDSLTPFEYRFEHRLSYCTELIVARKFSDKLSMQIAGTFVYKNLVSPGQDNATFGITLSGMITTGASSGIIFEYAYRFNNRPEANAYPLAIGWEFGTPGHVFQIFLCSTNEIPEQDVYTINSFNYLKGNFAIGFNIKRTSWLNN